MPAEADETDSGRKMMAIDRLTFDPRLQLREIMHDDIIGEYAADVLSQLDPAKAVHTPDDLYLVYDGWHTAEAYKLVGRARMPVVVEEGTWDDALLKSAGSNARRGLARSLGDKTKAIRAILDHPEFGKRTSREIARICEVSDKFAGEVRAAYEAEVLARQLDAEAAEANGRRPRPAKKKPVKRIGKDGRMYAEKKPGKPRQGRRAFDVAKKVWEPHGRLLRALDELYRAFGKVTARDAIQRDEQYEAMNADLKAFAAKFKDRFKSLSKEQPVEE